MNSLQELWAHILETMFENKNFSETSFNLWLKDLELVEMSDTSVFIRVENKFKMDFISKKYIDFISETVAEVLGFDSQIVLIDAQSAQPDVESAVQEFISGGEKKDYLFCYPESLTVEAPPPPEPELPEPELTPMESPGVGSYLAYSEKYTFDNFIVGTTNRFAYNACRAVAKSPSDMYNPLYIYGPSGLGKTHLLYAITNEILKNRPEANVLYVDGEDFTNQLVELLTKKGRMDLFREKYRSVDVLLVDDIQFIAGKASTQEEFFHTFNALHQQNKQIIVTADRPHKEISTLEERLKTRFEWGLITDIQPPDLELRIAIIKRKCDEMGLVVDYGVLEYIAEQIKDNIRQMEGVVKKLKAYSFINGIPVDMAVAKTCIKDLIGEGEPQSVLVERIFKYVSEQYGVPYSEIMGKKRNKEIVVARHAVIYLLIKVVTLSSNNVATMFGLDHTSVLYATKTVEEKAKKDQDFAKMMSDMVKKIRG